jgi:hypothetical protein
MVAACVGQSMNPIIQVSSVKEVFGIKELQRQLVSMTELLVPSNVTE